MNQEKFAEIKDRIIYVLESVEAEQINARPHEEFLDMMKTFRVYKYDGENDFNITWADLEKWGVGLDVIAEAAKLNTSVLTPPMIYQVAATSSGIRQIEIGDSIDAALENMANINEVKYPMYMLTNPAIYYGAGSILNEPLMKRIADLWKEDILLLPSSVHEFLMVPFSRKRMELEDWQDTVSTMNSKEDMKGSVLSNSVYLYDWVHKAIVIGYSPDK